jgi:hypothetical protein
MLIRRVMPLGTGFTSIAMKNQLASLQKEVI